MNSVDKTYEDLIKASDVMDEITEEITDEQAEEIGELLDDMTAVEKMEHYTPTEEDLQMEKEGQEVMVNIDPFTGKINNVLSQENLNKNRLTVEELLEMDPDTMKTSIDITEDSVKSNVSAMFSGMGFNEDMSVEDVTKFMNALDAYRNNSKKVSYFNMLPDQFKKYIDTLIGGSNIGYVSQKEARNYVVEGLFEQIIQDSFSNAMMTDLNSSLEESYKQLYDETKGEFSKYNNNQRYIFMTHLPEYAEKIKEEDPEKAEMSMKAHDAFVQSYTYQKMQALYQNTGKLRVKKIELEKFKKVCSDWIYKYNSTKMIINNLYDIFPVLVSEFGEEYEEDYIKEFVIVFTKYSMNMSPDKVDEHVFMYYFIKNILGLKYYNHEDEEEVTFYDKVRNHIRLFLNEIVMKHNPPKQSVDN
ncbi:MAG: hypothetical protein PHC62_00215 [Candidatus Izemoplasmatales bacterium]|nr:hypothetical protein [Candidatus Izemoplasmatales bacterium]